MEKRKTFLDVEDLKVYRRLCQLHIEVCNLSHQRPAEERYELGSQVRRSSNSAPAQLAEKNDDRHIKNKIEGVNRSRGEAGETVHHLYMAVLKKYMPRSVYDDYRARYKECICMLNGLEKRLEQNLPAQDRRWEIAQEGEYIACVEPGLPGFPEPLNTEPLNTRKEMPWTISRS